MQIFQAEIPGIFVIDPQVFGDDRGYFFESFQADTFNEHISGVNFIQDNESLSVFGVLRGLHYQLPPFAQSKLVRVVTGKVLDITVDIRKGSPTFGTYVAMELSGENKRQIFIPKGFAHGFVVLSKKAVFQYKVDNVYSRDHDRGIAFDDPSLCIDWRLPSEELVLSEKDIRNPILSDAEVFEFGKI